LPVNEDTWSEEGTSPERIEAALRELLRKRHAANQTLAPARVLNLVVIVDREWKGEVANRLERVGRYHASRTILCAVEDGRTQIDAVAVMTSEEPEGGGPGVLREQVEMDIGPAHLGRIDTLVDPVIVSELPTVLWSPHGHDDAVKALRGMTDVVLIDSDDLGGVDGPGRGVSEALAMLEHAYVVDLAWLRTTPWRERLAAAFHDPSRRAWLDRLDEITVRYKPGSALSALLLAGWLASRLQWEPQPLEALGDTLSGEALRGERGSDGDGGGAVRLRLEQVEQDAPGIVGVTVSCRQGFSLSLDRGRGGLIAHQRDAEDGEEREWQVLGASRGEGGILGEGVRQALLRDPTYGPALAAAGSFCEA
jgi:glucose-6-phosphate dehydrogenase assembly protein OpcA